MYMRIKYDTIWKKELELSDSDIAPTTPIIGTIMHIEDCFCDHKCEMAVGSHFGGQLSR